MEKINWGYVLTLVSSRDFVRDVIDYYDDNEPPFLSILYCIGVQIRCVIKLT